MREGKWICYPGDYEISLSERVQTRRYQRDFPVSPFWRLDSPWHNVRFFKQIHLEHADRLQFHWEGRISVFLKRPYLQVDDVYSYEFDGTMDLPAGDHYLEVWVYNPNGLPCLRIDGDYVISDESFEVGFNQIDMLPASVCDCGNKTPNTYMLPVRQVAWKREFEIDGDKIYDFGKIIFAFVRFKGVGKYRLYFGETLSEATNDVSHVKLVAETPYLGNKTPEEAQDLFCEQIEIFDLAEGEEHYSEFSKAFRYLRVRGGAHSLEVEEEYDDKPIPVAYQNADKRLEKIFNVSKYTFSMCAREFYLDGAKRDRWLWGGDAYEAEKAEYYYQYDTARIRRSIVALLGKSPVVRYVNHIMDYTLYTLISVWEYYQHTGDKEFLSFVEPMVTEHLRFCMSRLSEDGFLVSKKHKGQFVDWIFVDWGKLPDKNGEVSFEQILFYRALQAVADIYGVLDMDNRELLQFAEDLKKKTNEVFWNESRGLYVFARDEGVLNTTVTCHANVFALLYGFADAEKRHRITDNLIQGNVELSITPFMIEFLLAVLFEVGEHKKAAEMLCDYWGGMVDAGATTFWETYVKGEEAESATAMYARPFGRSHCHIWGAGPLYLIPRYYFGIQNEIDFGERFLLQPIPELIINSAITVPMKRGTLTVSCQEGKLSVYSSDLDGTLKLGEITYEIKKGEKKIVRL